MRWLAGVHLIEQIANQLERGRLQEAEVTFAILERMALVAKREGFELIVAGITDDAVTQALMMRGGMRFRTVDIAHDWSDPRYNLMPLDLHPNARGHAQYAEALARYLKEGDARRGPVLD